MKSALASLGYKSDKFLVGAGSKPQDFLADFTTGHPFDQAKALVPEWKSADLLFQLTDQELSRESSLFTNTSVKLGLHKSYIFIAIELKAGTWINVAGLRCVCRVSQSAVGRPPVISSEQIVSTNVESAHCAEKGACGDFIRIVIFNTC